MKVKKNIFGLLIVAIIIASFYSGLLFNGTRTNANDIQQDAPEPVDRTFIKDGDEILSPSQWIGKSINEISEIKPGMKRADLESSFSLDGGIRATPHATYVYRRCPIKIVVEFKRAGGKEERDKDGRLVGGEYDDDVITKVSKPYLEYPAND